MSGGAAADRRHAVEDVIRRQFKLPDGFALGDDMGAGDVPGWDSLTWVELLGAVEEHFGIDIDLDAAARLETIGQIKAAVSR